MSGCRLVGEVKHFLSKRMKICTTSAALME